mmetsp:Transcript_12560/g.50487  ORF Transcript_12560/g.50487 Transcript_12560/m.50487 type:complete len:289 (-) Transcript_12560:163-1029(-)
MARRDGPRLALRGRRRRARVARRDLGHAAAALVRHRRVHVPRALQQRGCVVVRHAPGRAHVRRELHHGLRVLSLGARDGLDPRRPRRRRKSRVDLGAPNFFGDCRCRGAASGRWAGSSTTCRPRRSGPPSSRIRVRPRPGRGGGATSARRRCARVGRRRVSSGPRAPPRLGGHRRRLVGRRRRLVLRQARRPLGRLRRARQVPPLRAPRRPRTRLLRLRLRPRRRRHHPHRRPDAPQRPQVAPALRRGRPRGLRRHALTVVGGPSPAPLTSESAPCRTLSGLVFSNVG